MIKKRERAITHYTTYLSFFDFKSFHSTDLGWEKIIFLGCQDIFNQGKYCKNDVKMGKPKNLFLKSVVYNRPKRLNIIQALQKLCIVLIG